MNIQRLKSLGEAALRTVLTYSITQHLITETASIVCSMFVEPERYLCNATKIHSSLSGGCSDWTSLLVFTSPQLYCGPSTACCSPPVAWYSFIHTRHFVPGLAQKLNFLHGMGETAVLQKVVDSLVHIIDQQLYHALRHDRLAILSLHVLERHTDALIWIGRTLTVCSR